MNEEMRSATEELETSKEELQSVNEELTTVNHELKSSVEELSRANADLNNLMASTDIGTIFLDRQLRDPAFHPERAEDFQSHPGRHGPARSPTSPTSSPTRVSSRTPSSVLRDLHVVEREVRVGETGWYMTRIAPYRTGEDRIAGRGRHLHRHHPAQKCRGRAARERGAHPAGV